MDFFSSGMCDNWVNKLFTKHPDLGLVLPLNIPRGDVLRHSDAGRGGRAEKEGYRVDTAMGIVSTMMVVNPHRRFYSCGRIK
jgi:hypothetical protein